MTKIFSSLYDIASKSNGVITHHDIQKGVGIFGAYPDRELLIAISPGPGKDAFLFPYFIENCYTDEQISLLSCVPNSLKHIRNDDDLRKVLEEFIKPPVKTGVDLYQRALTNDFMGATTSFGYWIHRYLMHRSQCDTISPNVLVYAKHAWPELQFFRLDQE